MLSRRKLLMLMLAAVGWTYGRRIEPNNLEITQVKLKLPRLSHQFDGYRIVQISDIHMGRWMNRDRLHTIVDLANQQNPDLVAVTGDLLTIEPVAYWARELVVPLRCLSPRDASVAILGNHDCKRGEAVARGVIRDSGIIDLNNDVYTLCRGDATLHIAGVGDYAAGKDDLDQVLRMLPAAGAAVLLAHEPDFADFSAATRRFDLQLSGHSHGGQVILPLIGPLVLPRYGRKYPLGRYEVGGMIQYTNRGVGMIEPFIRFNCRPELTVFTLEAG